MAQKLYCLFHSLRGVPWCYDAVSNRLSWLEGLRGDVSPDHVERYLLRQGLILPAPQAGETCHRAEGAEYWEMVDGLAGRLTLELTESCNMRCSYCVYSGKFPGRRKHSRRNMEIACGLRALEIFQTLSWRRKTVSVCFYGGETLLRFHELRELVRRAREILTPEVCFHIASNGTLLDDEIFSWLAENTDVYLDVTLNGPIHDRYRHYADGRPTLDDILSNLRKWNSFYPEPAAARLNLLCNARNSRELELLYDFYETMGTAPALITGIEEPGDEVRLPPDPENEAARLRLARTYLEKDSPFLCEVFEPGLLRIHHRSAERLKEQTMLTGTCLPLLSNIFVTASGGITLCEKLAGPQLGTVWEGIDRKSVAHLMQAFAKALKGRCSGCWAQRLCCICYRDFDLTRECVPEAVCEAMRKGVREDLTLYASVCEERPERLERFDSTLPDIESIIKD